MSWQKRTAPLAVLLAVVACERDQITAPPDNPRATTDQQCTPETCDPGGGGGTTFFIRVRSDPPPGFNTTDYLEGAYITSTCGNAFADALGQAEITCTSSSSISGTVLLRDGAIQVVALVGGNEVSTDKTFSGSGGG
jgi:hypothetical protein